MLLNRLVIQYSIKGEIMILRNYEDIIRIIEVDREMMNVLKAVQSIGLSDWYVCAGFVRSKIWDNLHSFEERTPIDDVDVVYFSHKSIAVEQEKEYERILLELMPHIPWSVKNQARMHSLNDNDPYTSSIDAISKFPETVTSLAITLDYEAEITFIAPHGIQDVLDMIVRPTPFALKNDSVGKVYDRRVKEKGWHKTWPKVQYISRKDYSS